MGYLTRDLPGEAALHRPARRTADRRRGRHGHRRRRPDAPRLLPQDHRRRAQGRDPLRARVRLQPLGVPAVLREAPRRRLRRVRRRAPQPGRQRQGPELRTAPVGDRPRRRRPARRDQVPPRPARRRPEGHRHLRHQQGRQHGPPRRRQRTRHPLPGDRRRLRHVHDDGAVPAAVDSDLQRPQAPPARAADVVLRHRRHGRGEEGGAQSRRRLPERREGRRADSTARCS